MIRSTTRITALVVALLAAPALILPGTVLCVHDDHVALEMAGATCCGSPCDPRTGETSSVLPPTAAVGTADDCTDFQVAEAATVLSPRPDHLDAPSHVLAGIALGVLPPAARQPVKRGTGRRPPPGALPNHHLLVLRTVVLTC